MPRAMKADEAGAIVRQEARTYQILGRTVLLRLFGGANASFRRRDGLEVEASNHFLPDFLGDSRLAMPGVSLRAPQLDDTIGKRTVESGSLGE